MAVLYNPMNLYHCRESNPRCTVTVGIEFLAAYSKKKYLQGNEIFILPQNFSAGFLMGRIILPSSQGV